MSEEYKPRHMKTWDQALREALEKDEHRDIWDKHKMPEQKEGDDGRQEGS